MIKHLKLTTLLIVAIALAGCSQELTPTIAANDKYLADHVVFSGQDDLSTHIAFGQIVRTFDSGGIMHLTIPARATTSDDLYVDYRVTYFDENHNPVDVPTAWKTRTLHSDIFETIQDNSSSPRARDFQIDFRRMQ